MLTGPNNSSAVSLLEMQLLGPSIETNAQQKYYQYSSQLWKRDALGMLEVGSCRQGALAQFAVPADACKAAVGSLQAWHDDQMHLAVMPASRKPSRPRCVCLRRRWRPCTAAGW
jgi:hypothetical protein